GFASGTVVGLRTRRDHAFLVTPSGQVALVTLDPVLTLPSGARVELATHEWASGAVAPRGYLLLATFDQTDGVPRWRWRGGGRLGRWWWSASGGWGRASRAWPWCTGSSPRPSRSGSPSARCAHGAHSARSGRPTHR